MAAPSPDEMSDDLEAARKAADDYMDALVHLSRHKLPYPMLAWVGSRIDHNRDDERVLRNAATTFGSLT